VKAGVEPPFREDLSLEAEEESLLEAVTRLLLVKNLMFALTFCKVWKLMMEL
jgi:hypothetical protein